MRVFRYCQIDFHRWSVNFCRQRRLECCTHIETLNTMKVHRSNFISNGEYVYVPSIMKRTQRICMADNMLLWSENRRDASSNLNLKRKIFDHTDLIFDENLSKTAPATSQAKSSVSHFIVVLSADSNEFQVKIEKRRNREEEEPFAPFSI